MLKQYNIKSILTVAKNLEPYKCENIIYKNIPIEDDENENIQNYLLECIEFINLNIKNGNILIHCAQGI